MNNHREEAMQTLFEVAAFITFFAAWGCVIVGILLSIGRYERGRRTQPDMRPYPGRYDIHEEVDLIVEAFEREGSEEV